ncbi:MAG TPA: ParB/RepB/Spo0J family partition protein [Gemmatimonadota bacterium]|nr:ParB/RepB/Spo0J family partition protein [Gemmatimonadota bacterium]
MSSRKRLGKGLGALLGESAVEAARGAERGVEQIDVSRIVPNRFQPRGAFDDEGLAELAASIAQVGVLQPVIVMPREDGEYELVSGERRWRAARLSGLAEVPALVREVDDRELLEFALIENLQREDLDPIEEAAGYARLIQEFDLTQGDVAERVGKSRPAIANALRLLDLSEEVRAMIRQRALSAGHGRALLGLADRRRLVALARKASRGGLSVRQTERLVRRENSDRGGKRPAAARSQDLERQRMEEDLQRQLGTRVTIRATARGRGRIEVAFYSFEDLERIVERLQRVSR